MRRKKLILFQSIVAQSDLTMPPLVSGLRCNNKNRRPKLSHSRQGARLMDPTGCFTHTGACLALAAAAAGAGSAPGLTDGLQLVDVAHMFH